MQNNNNKPLVSLFHKLQHTIEHLRFVFLFVLLLSFFVIESIIPSEYLRFIATLTFFLLLIYSLYIISWRNCFTWWLIFMVGCTDITFTLINTQLNSIFLDAANVMTLTLFYSLMFYACIYYTLKDEVITLTCLFGSLCAYLFLGLIFASLYQWILIVDNTAFVGFKNALAQDRGDFIYFSFVTLTTLGYGDIQPISDIARTLTWIEAYIGQAYLTVLMALLVGRYLHEKNRGLK